MTYFALVGVYLIRGYNSRNSVYKTMRIPPGTHGPPSRSALEAFEVQIKSFRLGADDVFKSTKLCPDVGGPVQVNRGRVEDWRRGSVSSAYPLLRLSALGVHH
jgi:hypothetical protein